jgi:hypothetical protein
MVVVVGLLTLAVCNSPQCRRPYMRAKSSCAGITPAQWRAPINSNSFEGLNEYHINAVFSDMRKRILWAQCHCDLDVEVLVKGFYHGQC